MPEVRPMARSNQRTALSDTAPQLARATTAGDAAPCAPNAIRDTLEKLGLRRQLDLVLHLPLRHEDETELGRPRSAMGGEPVQLECEGQHTPIQFRPMRLLVCRAREGEEILRLRFFNCYPSQQRQLSAGTRVRVMGELR